MKLLFNIGVSHRTAPIDVRERLWLSEEEVRAVLLKLQASFFKECVVMSTCNRTELYGVPNGETVGVDPVRKFLSDFKADNSHVRSEHFYLHEDREAARQLFRVASGIDSMMLGDVQVLGQVKAAYHLAGECRTLGLLSTKLFQAALHTGKRARTETKISEGAVSISYGAVELAGKIFADLHSKTVFLIGAGKTSELTVKHLRSKGIKNILVSNRTRNKAEELVHAFGGKVIEFQNLRDEVHVADIIISSVESPSYTLTANDLSYVMKQRGSQPLFLIDIGVPRNIDPASNKIENVFLHDIDTLQVIVDKNLEKRREELPKVELIIAEELERFLQWQHTLQATPTIERLQSMAEEIRQQEVHKHQNRFRPEERENLDILTKRIVNKLLHGPISNLRNGQGDQEDETMSLVLAVRKLFGLSRRENPISENVGGDDNNPDGGS
ncbi:MAG: glutamyl-tRNA reductase [Bacteroidota bacterium]